MGKGFFKVIIPDNSAERLKIPSSFTNGKNEKLPSKVLLRDRFGDMWPIGVTKTGTHIYFEDGWKKFIEDTSIELGDFFIFDFDGNRIIDFKLLGRNGCEKEGTGGLKLSVKEEEAEEMNVEHQKNIELKGKNWDSDSSSNFSSDDNYEEEEEEKEEEEEHEEEEEEEEEEDNERAGKFNKKAPRLKAGCKSVDAHKVSDRYDPFGADVFKSGRVTQPKNPYFVTKILPNRKDKLYVPTNVVRDYKLELPSSMIIRDSTGREYETKVNTWTDGRKWLNGGWSRFCRQNLAKENDKCICEFVRGEHNQDLYLQVQVLHEGESSRPKKK